MSTKKAFLTTPLRCRCRENLRNTVNSTTGLEATSDKIWPDHSQSSLLDAGKFALKV